MAQDPPTVYVLYGDDEVAISEITDRIRDKMGDTPTASMNITRFTANTLNLDELEQACISMPFLTSRRLVIVEDPTRLMRRSADRERFFDLLRRIPKTTALLLIELLDFKATKGKLTDQAAQLLQWLDEHLPSTFQQRCEIPRGSRFTHWIKQRTQQKGGEIETRAAHLLAELVSEDPLLADQEIRKLLDYVDFKRPIQVTDIEALTPFHGQSDVFAMVDAVGQRDVTSAMQNFKLLLEDQSPRYAFAMVIRQFRLLLLARHALDNHLQPSDALDVHPYVAKKITAQARNFHLRDLERVYHYLLTIDVGSKTGRSDLIVSLERLIASLSV